MSAFSTALSGLSANNTALNIVGDNLANLNTESFKSNEVLFKDVMGQVANSAQIGAGVAPPITERSFTQGSIQSTGGPFDAAIQGNGFFVVRTNAGDTQYTRDGSFRVDGNGILTTATGERVQGWSAVNGVLTSSGPVSDISVNVLASQAPSATTAMTLNANLNAAAAVNDTFSTPIQVVDSLGATHVLTAKFTKTAANTWGYDVSIPGEDLTAGTAGTPSSLATGSLTFDSSGNLTTPAAGTPITIAAAGLASGAADLSIAFSPYNTAGASLITQYAQASAASGSTQTGVQAAQITGVQITNGGTLLASFSSGKQVAIAQIAMASIANPDSLMSAGNNNYQLGPQTLTPSVGEPDTGIRGQIVGGSIEASNVDLAKEFTNLIVYQSGYQANSKVIQTIDQMTQVLLNIK